MREVLFTCRQDRHFKYNVIFRRVSATILAVENQCVTYCECVFIALGIWHAKYMRHVVICGLSGATIVFFFTLSYKWYDFRKISY